LTEDALEILVQGMTREGFISEHLILPQGVTALCEDQNLRMAVLASLPTLDDGGLAVQQTGGNPNRGIQIPGASESRSQPGIANPGPSGSLGKQVVGSDSARSGSGTAGVVPARRRKRRAGAGCAAVMGPSSLSPP